MAGNEMELSANMAAENSRSSEVDAATLTRGHKKPEAEFTVSGSGRLPEVDAVALVEKHDAETSDGDRSSNDRRRHRQRRKYGRLKRVRLAGLSLPEVDTATESESDKHFMVVDGPQVGIFRSATSSSITTAADVKSRSCFRRKLMNRNRKSTLTPKPGTSKTTTTTTTTTRQRCERYFKQFVAALFSTVGLLCLMVGYTALGGYVFCQIESSNEVTVKADMRQVTALFTSQ